MEEKPITNETKSPKPEESNGGAKGRKKSPLMKIALVLLIAIVAVAIYMLFANLNKSNDDNVSQQPVSNGVVAKVSITKDGFEPSTITVKKGTVVEWTSADESTSHVVAANPYPSHTDLPELVSPQLGSGAVYRFTFNETGTFKYHDDLKPTNGGTVIVN